MIDISFTNHLKPPVSDELPLDVFFSHLDDVIFFFFYFLNACTCSRAAAALDAPAHALCFCQGLKMRLTVFTVSFTRFLCVHLREHDGAA